MEKIKEIIAKYEAKDARKVNDAIDMLCKKGVANGCYQDITILMDILSILGEVVAVIDRGEVLQ